MFQENLIMIYSKACEKRPFSKRSKLAFNTDYHLMHVKSIAEAPKGAFCNTCDLIKLPFVIKIFI